MGYDFHITRRSDWSEKGNDITADEWLAYVQSDKELMPCKESGLYFVQWNNNSNACWLDWNNGQIYTKNPCPELIRKMISISKHFNSKVQGDDGELYSGADNQNTSPDKENNVGIDRLYSMRDNDNLGSSQFSIGDRVVDSFGNKHTIVHIDLKAEHGMGLIKTRRDDGSELCYSMIAHGLSLINKSNK